MVKRRYSDDDRANALAALAANDGNVEGTAKQLGIPEATLRHWFKRDRHPEAAILGDQKKPELADKLELIAHRIADAIPRKIAKATLNQAAVALGISIEKMRLLREQSTSNPGPLDDTERVARITALLDAARARRDGQARGGDPAAGVDPAAGPADQSD